MDTPRLSIGLTVYNGDEFLEATLESFLAQTCKDFELIICDNASTDRTGEISQAYARQDARVKYFRNEKNLGLAGNHNRAVMLANGEYFKWAAADDVLLPTYLERCVEVLDRDPSVVLAYPQTQFIDAAGNPLPVTDPGWNLCAEAPQERFRSVLFKYHWANAVVGLIRTAALRRTRLMPAYAGGDFSVLGELSLLGKFHEIPQTLFLRRLHENATSHHRSQGTHPGRRWLIRCWTGTDRRVSLPIWRIHLDHCRTIVRSKLPLRYKLTLFGALMRHMRWERTRLISELFTAATDFSRHRESDVPSASIRTARWRLGS